MKPASENPFAGIHGQLPLGPVSDAYKDLSPLPPVPREISCNVNATPFFLRADDFSTFDEVENSCDAQRKKLNQKKMELFFP
jgi:hypothetical protein